jgi:hypothetical protein
MTIFRQARESVEYVRTSSAADVALRDAQICGGHDERQCALRTDCKHFYRRQAPLPAQRMSVSLPRQTGPTLPKFEGVYIKPRAVSLCHVGSLVFQQSGEHD